jgi:hypothetical protein
MKTTEHPKTVCGDIGNPPKALAPLCLLHNWITWKWERNGKGWTKPPYQAATGHRARNNDSTTWGTHTTAVKAVLAGKAHGIGFVLTGTEIGAIDLDKCRDPETGATADWAAVILKRAAHTYIEITVSGTGFRVIGTVKGAAVHRKFEPAELAGLEVYRKATRYITVSGKEVGRCVQLGNIDALIDDIVAEQECPADAQGQEATKDHKGNGTGDPAGDDIDALIKNGAPEGKRSDSFARVVWSLAGAGLSADKIEARLAKYPQGIAAKYLPKRLRPEIKRCYGKWERRQVTPPQQKQTTRIPQWPDITDKGDPRRTYSNARAAIQALGITCRYDEFHDRMLVGGHPIQQWAGELSDAATVMLRQVIIDAFALDPGKEHVADAATALSLEHTFNPIVSYLDSLKWDGKSRLDTWLSTYLGAEDTPLNRAIGRATLAAAVRRVRKPGTKFDHILTLEGPEGRGKSTAIAVLAGTENFSDQTILTQSDKEQQELLRGVWIYEIADLAGMKRAEVEKIKAFASRTHDRARPAYGRRRVDAARRGIFIATTNEDEYLKSQTGNRRFWPVVVAGIAPIDIAGLRRDRDQLWAEAAHAEAAGATITLSQELWGEVAEAQDKRREHDPWDDVLGEVSGLVYPTADGLGEEERISTTELFKVHLEKPADRVSWFDHQRLKRAMHRLGWHGPELLQFGTARRRGYFRKVTKMASDPSEASGASGNSTDATGPDSGDVF